MGKAHDPIRTLPSGQPVWAQNEAGVPICGYTIVGYKCGHCGHEGRRRTDTCAKCKGGVKVVERPCRHRTLAPNGRCYSTGHGGNQPGRPIIHGERSEKLKALIRSREQFLTALGGEDSEKVHELIDKLHGLAVGGNLEAIKYTLDQLFGGPRTTIVNEIGDRVMFARMVRVTARHLTGEAFEAWLSDLKREMDAASE